SGIISQLVPANMQSPGLRALLGRMAGIQNPITSWLVVLQAVKSLEPKVIPVEAAKIKAADVVAIRAVEAARKTQKKAVISQIITLSVLVVVVVFLIWYFLISNERDLRAQVQIPAGSYPVGSEGHRVQIQAFEIDKYEVTIGQYAEFIEFCEANGRADEHKYDHPNAPKNISHVTEDAKTLINRAKQRGAVVFADPNDSSAGVPVDLNCPMVCVSWWDAYAYAKYMGRDLPTQEEWEAAARGSDGYRYPWGSELDYGKFNSNRDYKPLARGKLKPQDGYNYWAPVDEFSTDVSPFKVIGMAGNVAEWSYRNDGKRQFPIVKGGSFASNPIAMFESVEKIPAEDCHNVYPASRKPKSVLQRVDDDYYVGDTINANTRTLYIGFRTVKRK
ncbi:MAG: SUMF1/EgtB/PvdO family nonheme iron enzyme, partial [Verrucomicrobiota bacterium]